MTRDTGTERREKEDKGTDVGGTLVWGPGTKGQKEDRKRTKGQDEEGTPSWVARDTGTEKGEIQDKGTDVGGNPSLVTRDTGTIDKDLGSANYSRAQIQLIYTRTVKFTIYQASN